MMHRRRATETVFVEEEDRRRAESKFEVYKDAVERVITDRGDLKENK